MELYRATQIRQLELDLHPNQRHKLSKGDKIHCRDFYAAKLISEVSGKYVAILSRVQNQRAIERTVYSYEHPDSKRVILTEETSDCFKKGEVKYPKLDKQLREAGL